jgi:hypothetical protein
MTADSHRPGARHCNRFSINPADLKIERGFLHYAAGVCILEALI